VDLLYARCGGLDVHKDLIVACRRIEADGRLVQEVRTFGATTRELGLLSDWLEEAGITHVVMEATGIYWRPVWHILEGSFDLTLVNAQHAHNVPGRKSDVGDSQWLAELLAHGLVRGSFVPPSQVQAVRELTRTRKQLARTIVQNTQRIQKALEGANIKLSSVVTDTLGLTSRLILKAMIKGETSPEALANLAQGLLKKKRPELVEALRGQVTEHHRFIIGLHLKLIESLEKEIGHIEKRLSKLLKPLAEQENRLTAIHGVSTTVAQVILGEIGWNMERFLNVAALISWAGLCPQMHESAGKKKRTRLRKGASWLKTVLVQAAWAAIKVKESYLRSKFMRIKSRRGPGKAIIAIAADILKAGYFILRDGVNYKDLGPDYYDRQNKNKVVRRHVKQLESLGYKVTIASIA
jgi:transposase